MPHFVTRFNRSFRCAEYRSTRGGFTLHTSKAIRFDFEDARDELLNHRHCTIIEAFEDPNELLLTLIERRKASE